MDPQDPVPVGRFEWERAVRNHMDAPQSVRLIAFVLATYATTKTGTDVRPGVENIVRASGTSRRTVLRALRLLQDIGWLIETRPHKRTKSGGLATEYRLRASADRSRAAARSGVPAVGAPRLGE